MPQAKTMLFLSAALAATPAMADPISSRDAAWHMGEIRTVTGRAAITVMPSGEVYIDLDGSGDGAPLSAYISRWNRAQFQDVAKLDGRMVQVRGQIGVFRDRPEIFLQDPAQLSAEALPPEDIGPAPQKGQALLIHVMPRSR
jgi:hypothetical protein